VAQDAVTAAVTRFYEELPFNYRTVAEGAAIVKSRNQVEEAYADLHRVLSGAESVIDIGCGAGWFVNTCAFHYRLPSVGVDLSAKAIARAREISAELGISDRTEFRQCDLFRLEEPRRFDVVTSIGALHHTGDFAGAVEVAGGLVGTGGALYLGLYHAYGRKPLLELFQRYRDLSHEGRLTPADFDEALGIYSELDGKSTDPTFLRSWFRDQVIHPHETQHTLSDVRDVLSGIEFEIVSTSINRYEPFARIEDLFELEREYEERARQRIFVERTYFPGFFTTLARRRAAE